MLSTSIFVRVFSIWLFCTIVAAEAARLLSAAGASAGAGSSSRSNSANLSAAASATPTAGTIGSASGNTSGSASAGAGASFTASATDAVRSINSCCFSAEGDRLFTVDYAGYLRVWALRRDLVYIGEVQCSVQ